MSLSAGARLGPYEILSPLGAGGMGEVYRAKDARLSRTVAIKVLSTDAAGDADRRERFEREAKAISALDHPNICALYDVGDHQGAYFLVMPCLDGQTLAERLIKGALPIDQVIKIAVEIATALDAAHRHGIVHRGGR
jgi:serine/threonine protein kinase